MWRHYHGYICWAWQEGLVGAAIAIVAVSPFIDFRGKQDSYGHDLRVTSLATADALSAAAGLVMGKISRTRAAIIRGSAWQKTENSISVRPVEKDLFL
jgi:F420-0:gamma-glutamyl ligase